METLIATGAATAAWFITAAALFFNPIVDPIYRSQEGHPAVRALPKVPATIGKILLAVAIQSFLWALVFRLIEPVLPGETLGKGLAFGAILVVTKLVPRDVDRLLLTTYPTKRMLIELVIGIVCAIVVGVVYAYVL